MLNFIGVVFFGFMIFGVIKARQKNKNISRTRALGALGLVVFGLLYNGYRLTHDTPEEVAAKKAQAEISAKYHACWEEFGTTDTGRNTAVMVTEFEFNRMGKSYLLQGKDDDDKIRMFCDANSKQK